jgi:hypothetical protein
MCLVGGVKSIFLPFQAILSTFLFFRKKPKKSTPAGAGGGPRFFFTPNILWLKTPCKISKPYDNPFWEKSNIAKGHLLLAKDWVCLRFPKIEVVFLFSKNWGRLPFLKKWGSSFIYEKIEVVFHLGRPRIVWLWLRAWQILLSLLFRVAGGVWVGGWVGCGWLEELEVRPP